MNKRDGLRSFQDVCSRKGIDMDQYFHVGRGTENTVNSQYKLRAARKHRKSTHQYAIQFCATEGVYVAWDLSPDGKREVEDFYIQSNAIIDFSQLHKGSDVSCNETDGTLPCYLFTESGIDSFLENHLSKERNHA